MAEIQNFLRAVYSLTLFEKSLNEKGTETQNSFTLDFEIKEVEYLWDQVRQTFNLIAFSEAETTDSSGNITKTHGTTMGVLSEKKLKAYRSYIASLAKLGEQKALANPISNSTVVGGSASAPPKVSRAMNIPACDTEVFSGDYLEWPTFRDHFTAIYADNDDLTGIEKILHLSKKTKGEANDIVRDYPITNEGFISAWQALRNNYENERVLINAQLKTLFNLEPISVESGKAIRNIQGKVNRCLSALKMLGVKTKYWDPFLIYHITTKLPDMTLALWEQQIMSKKEYPKWAELEEFLSGRFRALQAFADTKALTTTKPTTTKSSQGSTSGTRKVQSHHAKSNQYNCLKCKDQKHHLRVCPQFISLSVKDRLAFVNEKDVCRNCLRAGHRMNQCSSKFLCSVCQRKHHSLLHTDSEVYSTIPSDEERATPSGQHLQNVHSGFTSSERSVVLGTAMVTLCLPGEVITARALLDPGSEATFISERLQRRLNLKTSLINAQVSGLNNAVSAHVKQSCHFTLGSPRKTDWTLPVTALILPYLTGALPAKTLSIANGRIPYDLPLADEQFNCSAQIDILIGGDIYPCVLLEGVRRNILGTLLAQETVFGWTLTGPVEATISASTIKVSTFFNEISVDKCIRKFWELEEIPSVVLRSEEDTYCEDLFRQTTKRNSQGRFIVSLPFKERCLLGDSRDSAIKQFRRNEFRLAKTPEFKNVYDQVLTEYLDLGHMEQITYNPSEEKVYYLPHHAVRKDESTTTKVRVVFNASAKSSNGKSLNDVLFPGPILQKDLMILILQWRFCKYVFNGDIEKMYRQILVDECSSQYQRIVFRKSLQDKIEDFQLKTVTFGVNCAPYLAIRTLIHLGEEVKENFPLASEVLQNYMYVDDALVGAHDIPSAIKIRDELINVLGSAGFVMRKWTSNCKEVLEDLPKTDLLDANFLELEDHSIAKTLGIRWDAHRDEFFFNVSKINTKNAYTKREILSRIAKLFDPAGWLGPIVIVAKMLMQEIWLAKVDWDETVPEPICIKWNDFLMSHSLINNIRIPRWIHYTPYVKIEFHGFCDASEKAYAAALYTRIEWPGSHIQTNLLAGKTKVAPVKAVSVPRLELCGAVLLAKLISTLIPTFKVNAEGIYCWTDSTIVLAWLKKPACTWNTFVANRVTQITDDVGTDNWNHVISSENPADIGSRGISPELLSENSLWWHGPAWLSNNKDDWPIQHMSNILETDLEMKRLRAHFTFLKEYEDILERFSSFSRALRVLAITQRFLNRIRKRVTVPATLSIQRDEIEEVKSQLIILAQKVHYPNEYKNLSDKKAISPRSSLASLNPFLDTKNIMRVGGRLANADTLSYDERFPIILPYNCKFSKLLVCFIHEISLHGGNSLMLRLLRTQYWVIKAKNLIKSTIFHCKVCTIHKQRVASQIMAALPKSRTQISRPFAITGVDFAGPFEIKNYAGRGCRITKGYVCVFVCFSTKAIHLEVTTDLSTATFLAAFARFSGRRGCPTDIYSDNGSNFIGASRSLKQDFKNFLKAVKDETCVKYSHQRVHWHFIPAGAPHMGGLWESAVRSFKTHLKKVASTTKFTFEELATVLCKVEACLNSRPICPMSDNPDDTLALTPGHFLIGSPLMAPAEPDLSQTRISLMNRWQKVKAISQSLCSRWKSEYLKELHKRNKWKFPQKDLQVGQLVVIKEENLDPQEWRLGRIIKTYQGKDNQVRVADVKTQRGMITRPVVKLVLLPIA